MLRQAFRHTFFYTIVVLLMLQGIGQVPSVAAQFPAPDEFSFVGPPTISVATYQTVYCQPRHGLVSDACPYASQMYQVLVDAGIDPVIELAFAAKETEFGVTGPGRSPQYNIHNIMCNGWDGGTCEGPYHTRFSTYTSYPHAINAWVHLMLARGTYVDAGNSTFRTVIPIYAPSFENDTALYIAQTESWVRGWRSWDNVQDLPTTPLVWGAGMRMPPPQLGDPRYLNGKLVADSQDIGITTPPDNLDSPSIPPGAMIIDNNDAGFSCNQDTWIPGWCGVNNKHIATPSTSAIEHSTSRASWVPEHIEPGTYDVQAYIPGCGSFDATQSAQYVVTHDGGTTLVPINQAEHAGLWVSLGTYAFGARFTPMVEISDLAGDDKRNVLVDALAWIPSEEPLTQASSTEYSGVPLPDGLPDAERTALAEYAIQPLNEQPEEPATQPSPVSDEQPEEPAIQPSPVPQASPVALTEGDDSSPHTAIQVHVSTEEETPKASEIVHTSAETFNDVSLLRWLPNSWSWFSRVIALFTHHFSQLYVSVAPGVSIDMVRHGGNMRSEPNIWQDNVLCQVCPNDSVAIFEQQTVDGHNWVRVRIVSTGPDCVEQRADVHTEGWISTTLIHPD